MVAVLKKKEDKHRWPGDLLTVMRANLITHEMLGITEMDQIKLPGLSRAGGKEGREADKKMEVCRVLILKWLEECDVYEHNIGTDKNPEYVIRSRWVPDFTRAEYGEHKDGQPDDFFRMITDNFHDFFSRMELFVPRNVGRGNEVNLAKIGETPEMQRERRLNDPRHIDNKAWFEANFEKVRSEVWKDLADEPMATRLTPTERVTASKVTKTRKRGRPRGSKDVVKRKEKGMPRSGSEEMALVRARRAEQAAERERTAAIAGMKETAVAEDDDLMEGEV